jgi:dienelactone hydrolase
MKACIFAILIIVGLSSCKEKESKTEMKSGPQIKEETVYYKADSVNLKGYVYYDSSSDKKRPVVLVIHEWWGLTDYPRMRAKQLAELGYIAMAIDMYGNGVTADNPTDAQKMSTPFYTNPQMSQARFDAALRQIKAYPVADTNQVAAMGYCFGGGIVLNLARLGEPLKGVVSFHGSLIGVPANKDLLKAKILVCHGAADEFVKMDELDKFKKQMDSIHADYSVKIYPDATHAFTNPNATNMGKKFALPIAYNATADTASWKDMKEFFQKFFK